MGPMRRATRQMMAGAALALLALGCGAAQHGDAPTGTPLEQARQIRDRGDLPGAEARFLVLAQGGDILAEMEYCETLLMRGQHAKAAARLQGPYDKQPDSAELASLMARALDGAGLHDDAVTAYVRRLRLMPHDNQAALRLAELLIARGEAAMACEVAAAALKSSPDHAQLHTVHAKALLARGRLPLALAAAERATALAPMDAQAWVQLAQVHLLYGELEKAQTALEHCLKIDSQHADALRDLGIVALELGDAGKAVLLLQRAVSVAPESAVSWTALGLARQRSKNLIGALAALEQALRLQPMAVQIYVSLADVYMDMGMPRRAQSEARRGRERLGSQASAELRNRVEKLLLRSIVVSVLADALCRGSRDGSAIQAAAEKEARDDGIEGLISEIAATGADATDHVRAAQARCAPQAPATPPQNPAPSAP